MAHMIDTTSKAHASMMYVGETPWHGLGQQVSKSITLDEAAVASGMDYKILRSTVRYPKTATAGKAMREGGYIGSDDVGEYDGKVVLLRSDTQALLGIVSDAFQVVQPMQVLEWMFETAEMAGLDIETAGVLYGGAKYWALARVREDAIALDGNDLIAPYIMLATGADGNTATTGMETAVRAVCANTVSLALRSSVQQYRLSHRSRFSPEACRKALGIDTVAARWTAFRDAAETLSRIKMTTKDAELFTMNLLQPDAGIQAKIAKGDQALPRGYANILNLFNGAGKGATLASADGTAWGLLNAVTEHVDWTAGRSQDARLNSAWFGAGADLKLEAANALLELA